MPTKFWLLPIVALSLTLGACEINVDSPDDPPATDGSSDGTNDGSTDGSSDGTTDGNTDGSTEGSAPDSGSSDGNTDGTTVDAGSGTGGTDGTVTVDAGASDGSPIVDAGSGDGTADGTPVTDAGTSDGSADGTTDGAAADAGPTEPSWTDPENNLFVNGGFENGTSDWLKYSPVDNNNFASVASGTAFFGSDDVYQAHSGSFGAKTWGKYDGNDNDINIYQEWLNGLTPGASYQISGHMYHAGAEAFSGDNMGYLFIKTFTDNVNWGSNFIRETMSEQLNASTTANVWLPYSACATIESKCDFRPSRFLLQAI